MKLNRWLKFPPFSLLRRFHTIEKCPSDHEYAKELLSPNWEAVESHYGTSVPQIWKDFYLDPKKILQMDFELAVKTSEIPEGIHVQFFTPISELAVDGFFEGLEQYIDFASDGGGGRYVIDIREVDPKVYMHCYDIGRFRFTGFTLSQFLTTRYLKALPFDEFDG
ncbi:MAG: hypothetical protein ABIS50_14025 [Luteolibacter sp.]|uniref:hypothetical protein n=1 Tax=Luteolibacter sp. TaxID=1962973 RepID=UPI00326675A9